jgi:hypothetical protein
LSAEFDNIGENTMTFEERCKLATDCLPMAEYRTRLEALHAEMLADMKGAEGMIQAMKAVIDKDDARWKFLHTTHQDAQGFEWCVMRVKWENGRISEAWHTNSNLADMDAEIARQAELSNTEAQRAGTGPTGAQS